MDSTTVRQLIIYFQQFVTPNKLSKMEQVLAHRTRHITVVLEDLYQPYNASACIRSCDGFGIQDVHIIERKHSFSVQEAVSMGAGKWISVFRSQKSEQATKDCLTKLKAQGYTIVATTPHERASFIHELSLDRKIALVFGSELEGISHDALACADAFVAIPMYGFTESFNVSVSVALSLYDVTMRLRNSSVDWRISGDELDDVRLEWLKAQFTPDRAALLEKRFFLDRQK